MERVFSNGPGDLGSIPGRVIPKTLKIVLDTSLLNTRQYKVRIEGKRSNPGKGVGPSPKPRCSSYWKRNPPVAKFTLLFLTLIISLKIYIFACITLISAFFTLLKYIYFTSTWVHTHTHTHTHICLYVCTKCKLICFVNPLKVLHNIRNIYFFSFLTKKTLH